VFRGPGPIRLEQAIEDLRHSCAPPSYLRLTEATASWHTLNQGSVKVVGNDSAIDSRYVVMHYTLLLLIRCSE